MLSNTILNSDYEKYCGWVSICYLPMKKGRSHLLLQDENTTADHDLCRSMVPEQVGQYDMSGSLWGGRVIAGGCPTLALKFLGFEFFTA